MLKTDKLSIQTDSLSAAVTATLRPAD